MQPLISNLMQLIDLEYLKREILTIIWMDVFCVRKPGFPMPGHIYRDY